MRRKIIAGNWKMHLTWNQAEDLVQSVISQSKEIQHTDIQIYPPLIYAQGLHEIAKKSSSSVHIGVQDLDHRPLGAFTGCINAIQILSTGIQHCIIGHSERRQYFHESNELLRLKVKSALEAGMRVIYCCGEQLADRNDEQHFQIVEEQLLPIIQEVSEVQWNHFTIAYEPVWAIGTGISASAKQAQEMHHFIRTYLLEHCGKDVSQLIPILYGGSVTPQNAEELFSQSDIDGALVGGASLKAESFQWIAQSMEKRHHS